MAEQSRPPYQPNFLDVMSTWVFGEPAEGATKRPQFRVKVMGNVPRLMVKTQVPNDKNNGRIDFNLDLPTFTSILHVIEEIVKGNREKAEFQYIDDFVGGKKLDQKIVVSRLLVGRGDNGRIYIAIIGHERPKIRFYFGPSQYHNAVVDGQEDEKLLSEIYAMGFVGWAGPVVRQMLLEKFDPEAKNVAKMPTQQGGQGGGGYNRGGGGGQYNGGGSNSGGGGSLDDFDDF